MSGYELQNKTGLSWRRKAKGVSDWKAVTSTGSLFQSLAYATGNA